MQVCDPLPLLSESMNIEDLIKSNIADQYQYKKCAKTHNDLVDAIKKREQKAP